MCVREVLVQFLALNSPKLNVLGQTYRNFWHPAKCNLMQMLNMTTIIPVMMNLIPSHSSLNFILQLGSMGHGVWDSFLTSLLGSEGFCLSFSQALFMIILKSETGPLSGCAW